MAYSHVRHLAFAIHPATSKEKLMLMLTFYADETGHGDDPTLTYVGMAGFVAPLGEWKIFEDHWKDTLKKAGLEKPFHMKEFAHSEPGSQFESWKGQEERRRMLLGRLLDIILATRATPVGGIISVPDFRSLTPNQQESFLDPYYIGFQLCTRGAALEALDREPEKVAMVYSYNQEFGATRPQEQYSVDQAGRAEQLWHAIKGKTDFGKWMGSYASSTPAELVQLQAADILAYELSKEFESRVKRPDAPMRIPLRRILTMVRVPPPRIRLFGRKELLRHLKEGNFTDQTGVEEIDDNQILSAMDSMKKWAEERGNIVWDFEP